MAHPVHATSKKKHNATVAAYKVKGKTEQQNTVRRLLYKLNCVGAEQYYLVETRRPTCRAITSKFHGAVQQFHNTWPTRQTQSDQKSFQPLPRTVAPPCWRTQRRISLQLVNNPREYSTKKSPPIYLITSYIATHLKISCTSSPTVLHVVNGKHNMYPTKINK